MIRYLNPTGNTLKRLNSFPKSVLTSRRDYHYTHSCFNIQDQNPNNKPKTLDEATNNGLQDTIHGLESEIEPQKNDLYVPSKRMDRPKLREMWELMSEIFVPTGNVADMMTRYHIKAKELLEKKQAQQQVHNEFGRCHPETHFALDDMTVISRTGKKTSLYELLVDNDKLEKDSQKTDVVSADESGSTSMYDRLQQEQDTFAEPSKSIKDGSQTPKKTVVDDEDSALMMFFDDPMSTSTTLYWPCGTLSFLKSDFERLIPYSNTHSDLPKNQFFTDSYDTLESDSWRDLITPKVAKDMYSFRLVRCRDPKTLVRWIGYYLVFPTRLSAALFYRISLTSEICGLKPQFRFVPLSSKKAQKTLSYLDPQAIDPPLLSAVPGISRDMCVLVKGLPPKYSAVSIAKQLWEFDLLPDMYKAIVKLKGDNSYDTESMWLIRFQHGDEPKRLRKMYHKRQWPGTDLFVDVEILD